MNLGVNVNPQFFESRPFEKLVDKFDVLGHQIISQCEKPNYSSSLRKSFSSRHEK